MPGFEPGSPRYEADSIPMFYHASVSLEFFGSTTKDLIVNLKLSFRFRSVFILISHISYGIFINNIHQALLQFSTQINKQHNNYFKEVCMYLLIS